MFDALTPPPSGDLAFSDNLLGARIWTDRVGGVYSTSDLSFPKDFNLYYFFDVFHDLVNDVMELLPLLETVSGEVLITHAPATDNQSQIDVLLVSPFSSPELSARWAAADSRRPGRTYFSPLPVRNHDSKLAHKLSAIASAASSADAHARIHHLLARLMDRSNTYHLFTCPFVGFEALWNYLEDKAPDLASLYLSALRRAPLEGFDSLEASLRLRMLEALDNPAQARVAVETLLPSSRGL